MFLGTYTFLSSSDKIYSVIYIINLVIYLSNICYLYLPNRYKNNTILREQITANFKARIYHIQPAGMEATAAIGVALYRVEDLVAIFTECFFVSKSSLPCAKSSLYSKSLPVLLRESI